MSRRANSGLASLRCAGAWTAGAAGSRCTPPSNPIWPQALDLVSAHNISFWDALLCATSIRMGLSFLMTEDLQDGRSLHGLTIVNPFRPDNDALVDHILPP